MNKLILILILVLLIVTGAYLVFTQNNNALTESDQMTTEPPSASETLSLQPPSLPE